MRSNLCTTAQCQRSVAVAVTMALVVLLDACGSSSKSLSASSSAELEQTCGQVQAVLSDGPEPRADPVGYAQAQVLPLRRIQTSDRRLREAIDRLASAYESFAAGDGGRSSKGAVNAAVNKVDAVCPGVAS
jgi:hypothetical protein